MMATGVLTIAIVSSILVLQKSFVAIDTARGLTLAGQIMQGELEKMRIKDWSVVSAYPAGPTVVDIDPTFTSNPFVGNRFTLTRTVTLLRAGMLQITVRVSWKTLDDQTHTASYTTQYGQNGLYDYFYNTT
jgi:hypothetical protein